MQSVSMSYLQDGVLKVVCDPEKRLKRVPAAALQTVQGALKTLDNVQYDRLRVSLIEEGFAAPVFTWHAHPFHHSNSYQCQQLRMLGIVGFPLPTYDVQTGTWQMRKSSASG